MCFPICVIVLLVVMNCSVIALPAQQIRLACACIKDSTARAMCSVVCSIIFSNCCRSVTVNGISCCSGGLNGANAGSLKSESSAACIWKGSSRGSVLASMGMRGGGGVKPVLVVSYFGLTSQLSLAEEEQVDWKRQMLWSQLFFF